jgi:hypothetical protein
MSVDLPKSIAAFIAADNSADHDSLSRCFIEHAVVRDEGQTFTGRAAIKQWNAATRKKYRHTIEPLESIEKEGNIVVTNRLTGNFPGSPIEVKFIFRLEGDKIASLQIRS